MEINAPFELRESCTEKSLALLSKTTLGTNGAKYKHLDTEEIISTLENPLYLSLERNENPIANITFCRRKNNWYIRYFAFDSIFQSENPKSSEKPSKLKSTLNSFFEERNSEGINFYAYIDPKNTRSKQMASTFGLNKIVELKTFSFSRIKPKKSVFLSELIDKAELNNYYSKFENLQFYFRNDLKRAKIYVLRDEMQNIIAGARIQKANWEIQQLPGKFGKFLVKIIPYLPIINKLIKPKRHSYLVADMLYFGKDSSSKVIESFFEAILVREERNVLMFWEKETNIPSDKFAKINWGLFRRLVGNPKVDLVYRGGDLEEKEQVFVSAIDLI